ncbi:MAG: nuclease-related domain-containing protein [Candidatus Falkowbacteria bacterium]
MVDDLLFWVFILVLYSIFFLASISILNKASEKNDNSYGIGYMVEELVGTKLAALGENYLVTHDIQKGGKKGNIDHVVVGPTGIFVIDSKSNRNKMIYYKNNERKLSELAEKFMNQVAKNSLWIHDAIKDDLGVDLFVYGIVVRPLNEDKKIETYCRNRVCIMDGNTVYKHIKNFDGKLSPEEINKINSFLCKIKRKNKKL